jgi:hypothetical protein
VSLGGMVPYNKIKQATRTWKEMYMFEHKAVHIQHLNIFFRMDTTEERKVF